VYNPEYKYFYTRFVSYTDTLAHIAHSAQKKIKHCLKAVYKREKLIAHSTDF